MIASRGVPVNLEGSDDLDPIVWAVYGGLDLPGGAAALLDLEELGDTLPPVAARVIGARLRVGATRRLVGSAAALAAPVFSIVALVSGVGYVLVGIAVSFVTLLGAWWVMTLRGTTIRGGRTLAAAQPRRRRPRRGALSGLVGTLPTGWIAADSGKLPTAPSGTPPTSATAGSHNAGKRPAWPSRSALTAGKSPARVAIATWAWETGNAGR